MQQTMASDPAQVSAEPIEKVMTEIILAQRPTLITMKSLCHSHDKSVKQAMTLTGKTTVCRQKLTGQIATVVVYENTRMGQMSSR